MVPECLEEFIDINNLLQLGLEESVDLSDLEFLADKPALDVPLVGVDIIAAVAQLLGQLLVSVKGKGEDEVGHSLEEALRVAGAHVLINQVEKNR